MIAVQEKTNLVSCIVILPTYGYIEMLCYFIVHDNDGYAIVFIFFCKTACVTIFCEAAIFWSFASISPLEPAFSYCIAAIWLLLSRGHPRDTMSSKLCFLGFFSK